MKASNGYEAGLIVDGAVELTADEFCNFVACRVGTRASRPAPTLFQLADLAASGVFREIGVRDSATGRRFRWSGEELAELVADARKYRVEDIAEALKQLSKPKAVLA